MKALIFAAGLGERMRPLTAHTPKPLLEAGGKALIVWHLEKLAAMGVREVVVNTSWLAPRFPQVLGDGDRFGVHIEYAYEGDTPLETGGGMLNALTLLGDAPFYHLNADTMWIDGVRPNLARMADAFDPARMDILLLMAPTATSIGYSGNGDYAMLTDGALRKRKENQIVPFVYAGVAIMSPALFEDAPTGEFSLTKIFDRANDQERLFGLRLDGVWMHVGTPDAVQAAEKAFLVSVG